MPPIRVTEVFRIVSAMQFWTSGLSQVFVIDSGRPLHRSQTFDDYVLVNPRILQRKPVFAVRGLAVVGHEVLAAGVPMR